jgi:hypothetical protein
MSRTITTRAVAANSLGSQEEERRGGRRLQCEKEAREGNGGVSGGGKMGEEPLRWRATSPLYREPSREVTLTGQKMAPGHPRLPPFPPHVARRAPASLHREK